ncbi:hypothetical protein BH23BAC3_BH23BAC3_32100 [soil metagenome]
MLPFIPVALVGSLLSLRRAVGVGQPLGFGYITGQLPVDGGSVHANKVGNVVLGMPSIKKGLIL